MTKSYQKILILILASFGAAYLLRDVFELPWGKENYWDHHGPFFLIFLALFPRLSLLLSSVPFGGVFWWLSWIFMPRMLIATLATLAYWNQNPILVLISWMIALGGEGSEKTVVVKRSHRWNQNRKKGFESAEWVRAEEIRQSQSRD